MSEPTPPASIYSMAQASAIMATAEQWRGARLGHDAKAWRTCRNRVIAKVALEYRLDTASLAEAFDLSAAKIRDVLNEQGLVAVITTTASGRLPARWVPRKEAKSFMAAALDQLAPPKQASVNEASSDRIDWPKRNDRFLRRLIPAAISARAIPPHTVPRVHKEAVRLRLPVTLSEATVQA